MEYRIRLPAWMVLIILLGVSDTSAQNSTSADGVRTACSYSNEQTTKILTTDIKYEHQFLLTASLSNIPYDARLADPDSDFFKSTASAFENEMISQLNPLIQNPPPSTVTVSLDAVVIQFRPNDASQATAGLTLDCVLSMDTDQLTASSLASHVNTVATRSIAYPSFVSSISASVSYCLREVILTQAGALTWPVTPLGAETETVEFCPLGTKYVGERSLGRRSCSQAPDSTGHAQWEPYICIDCGEIRHVDDALEAIYNEIRQNSSIVFDGVRRAALVLNEVTDITELGFKWVTSILEHVESLNPISIELLDAIMRLLSNLLQQDSKTFLLAEQQTSSSTRIVQSLGDIIKGTTLTSSAVEYVSIHPNIAASFIDIPQSQIEDRWISFGSIVGAIADAPLNEGSVGLLTGQSLTLLPNCEAYVHIKAEGPVSTGTTTVRALFVLYHNAKLFQSTSPSSMMTSSVAGRVVSANVRATRSPEMSIITRFKPLDPSVTNIGCRSWDVSLNNGHGDWSTPSCILDNTETSDRTKCQCDQLQAFTIFAEPRIETPDTGNGVSAFVRVGAVICMLCLTGACILYLAVKGLRTRRETQILGCLFFILAIFYLLLTIGIDQSGLACTILGALLHYCLLVAIGWIVVAWVHLYDLSRRKPWSVTWFLAKVSGPVWGIPFLFVILTAVVNTEHYITPSKRCFLSSDPIYNVIVTLVLPMILMLVAIAIAFGYTARNIILDNEAKPDLDPEGEVNHGPTSSTKFWKMWRKYILYLVLVVLFILTTVFAIVMANTSASAAEYIFSFLAIVKGVFIMVAFCIYHQEVRQAILIQSGYMNGPDSKKFQPYWSTSKWHQNNKHSVLPQVEENGNQKRFYLDDTQGSGAQTNQGFNPNSIPLSTIEMQRIGQNGFGGHVNNGMVVEAEYHGQPLEAEARV